VPEALSTLVTQLLEVEVARRPPDAREVIDRLEAVGPARWDADLVRTSPSAATGPEEPPYGSCTIEIASAS